MVEVAIVDLVPETKSRKIKDLTVKHKEMKCLRTPWSETDYLHNLLYIRSRLSHEARSEQYSFYKCNNVQENVKLNP